jgi:hypothetical protein
MFKNAGPGEASISAEQGMVAIVFSASVKAVALTPDEAKTFAAAIIEKADEAEEQRAE